VHRSFVLRELRRFLLGTQCRVEIIWLRSSDLRIFRFPTLAGRRFPSRGELHSCCGPAPKKCVTSLWSLSFVFNEIDRKLLGRVCRVNWCDRRGEGGKQSGFVVGPRAASLGEIILIQLPADARVCGSVLLSCLSRCALFTADRMSMLMDLAGK
jgi:hypothetical protein